MEILIPWLVIVSGLSLLFAYILVMAVLRMVKRLTETNKQLLILLAGQGGKPEVVGATMRALVASEKPPQGKLRGIGGGKKKPKETKPTNIDHVMSIGVK